MRIWVNTVFILTSRKTEIARSARGSKSQGPRAEDALAESNLVLKILVIWLQQITKVLSEGSESRNNHRTKIWQLSGYNPVHAKQKLLRKHKGACKSSWSRIGSLKSFTLTIPWHLAKPVKIFPGIIVRRHHTDRKQMRLLREQCAEWKKVRLQYRCNQTWMKNGGQIPWNAKPDGKTHTKGVLENLLKDPSFRLVHWLSITLSLRRTSQESINLERKSYLDCSLDTLCTRRGIWKGDIMVADIE